MKRIVYEDNYIILVDKPGGIPTHMLRPEEKGTIVNFLIEHCPSIIGVGTSPLMSGLVHRLDTDTSGLVLAAKDNEGFLNLRRQFKEHKVLKEYIALVHNRYNGPKVISNYIGKDPKTKKKVKVYSKARKMCEAGPLTSDVQGPASHIAVTEVIDKKQYGNYTLLKVRIKTGVRHQIRAQLANLGNPIAGDSLYQNLKTRKKDQLGLKRHFLHAYKIGFYHPKTNKWIEFESPLPEDLNAAMSNL